MVRHSREKCRLPPQHTELRTSRVRHTDGQAAANALKLPPLHAALQAAATSGSRQDAAT